MFRAEAKAAEEGYTSSTREGVPRKHSQASHDDRSLDFCTDRLSTTVLSGTGREPLRNGCPACRTPGARTVVLASTVADELDEVLTRAFVHPPYILVGHSLGGLYVQAYARSHPRKVAAVVLIDATTPLEPPDTFVSTIPPTAGTTAAAEEAGFPESMAALRAGRPFPQCRCSSP